MAGRSPGLDWPQFLFLPLSLTAPPHPELLLSVAAFLFFKCALLLLTKGPRCGFPFYL